jgi:MazG family protein
LGGVPKSLPAMVKAMRIQEKAKGAGFDWDKKEQVWEKVQEEIEEFQVEVNKGLSQDDINNEFGDILFSLINYARFVDINPEEALERTNKKFIRRFNHLEQHVNHDSKELTTMTLDELNVYWESAKKAEG